MKATPALRRLLLASATLAVVSSAQAQQVIEWVNTAGATAWYTAANWSPSTASGA